ncbi:type I-E CRISPR-associated endoribonuclease Cas2e [Enterovirga aerilata]|uniref:Type I-E CRISPR-associated endoribonuclease Cas2 n=1 Tax=Enterovirga aerilata TaxID=2730920 RepID=A0A849I3Z0_9HYPH|nr:type I-E CRISPR-associated endoribonuclease Cas2e [Enterovirga sp. DB1703]NNM74142.1 type I-E CRISPR-associated endoribonuclease Cas2 [Enterovirga sp. DB1703]
MPMTVVVTRDVADRYRGFLSSIMPEAAPGVFVGAELSKGVRERLWTVLSDWWPPRPSHPGPAARTLSDLDGALLLRR